jgi:hypothetical protein
MSKIRSFNDFIYESDQIVLNYFCFDWDDNLLKMPTKINMEELVDGNWIPTQVSTEMFAEIRSDKDSWRLGENPFIEFTDNGPRKENAFLDDLIESIGGSTYPKPPVKIAPSWFKFIECLVSGSLFAIITARGCKSSTIRMGIEYIIDNYLNDEQKKTMYNNCLSFHYMFKSQGIHQPSFKNISKNTLISNWLDNCGYYGVSSPEFIDKHKSGGADSPEVGKEIAIKEFINRCSNFTKELGNKLGKSVTFKAGMSDDDIKNVAHMKSVLSELKELYPEGEMTVFDTSKGGYLKTDIKESVDATHPILTKKVRTFETQSNFGGGAGDPMSSSIMPFTNFNTLATGELSNNLLSGGAENNPYRDRLKAQTRFLTKTSKEIFKNRKKKD